MTTQEELDFWRAHALECGRALQSLTPMGSEYIGKKVNGYYTTDVKRCIEFVREQKLRLHEAQIEIARLKDMNRLNAC